MNKRVIFFVSFLVCMMVRVDAAMAKSPQAYLKVKRLSSSKGTQKKWETNWGSYDRDYSRTIGISIFVRGMGKEADVDLEWYFVAKDMQTKKRWVYDSGVDVIHLDPAKPLEIERISKGLEGSVQNYAALGVKRKDGSKTDGYIVRVVSDGDILAVEASSHSLERIGKDKKKLQKVVDQKQKSIRSLFQ